jgi:Glyoxalase/Bleomycin resistance protein/Dioxygenase superfamily.
VSITKVGAVIWTTSKVQEVIEFYRAVGIPLEPDSHDEPDKTPHFEADVADTHFAVFETKDGSSGGTQSPTMVGLAVDDLVAVVAKLEKMNAKFKTTLEDTPWGKRVVVYDPDGRAVEIYQPGS